MRGGTEAGRPRRAVCVSYHCESNCLLLHQGFTCYCRENGYGYSSEVVVFSRSRRSGSEPPADYCITIISRSIFAAIAALLIRISICLPLSPPALLTPSCLRCQEPLGQDVAPSGTGHATVSLCEDCQWYGHERRCFLSKSLRIAHGVLAVSGFATTSRASRRDSAEEKLESSSRQLLASHGFES